MGRRWIFLLVGLGLVAVVAAIWVPPVLAGPTIECAGFSQAECDEAVPVVLKDAFASVPYAGLLPVVGIHIVGNDAPECPSPSSYVVTWLFGFNWGYQDETGFGTC